MSIVPIAIYCLLAALFIFGLTFHEELLKERTAQEQEGNVGFADRHRRRQTSSWPSPIRDVVELRAAERIADRAAFIGMLHR